MIQGKARSTDTMEGYNGYSGLKVGLQLMVNGWSVWSTEEQKDGFRNSVFSLFYVWQLLNCCSFSKWGKNRLTAQRCLIAFITVTWSHFGQMKWEGDSISLMKLFYASVTLDIFRVLAKFTKWHHLLLFSQTSRGTNTPIQPHGALKLQRSGAF